MEGKSIFSELLLEYYGIIIDDFNRLSKINDLINNNIQLFTQIQIKNHLNNLQDPKYHELIDKYNQNKVNPLPIDFLFQFHIKEEIKRELMNQIKIPEFVRNMCLTYMISSFESFLKNCLRLYYFYQPNVLKSQKKALDYEQIVNSKSIEELVSIIIEKELMELFHKSIDDISNYLKIKIGLDFAQNKKWDQFRERFFRRNILTHNEGISNNIYSNKINKDELGKFLKVDLEFNKNNDISSTMVDDEYYVCAYLMKDSNSAEGVTASTTIPLYDCDEGNIGTSTTKDSVTLFSTMKKYGESKAFYTTNQNTTAAAAISNPKEVKITINVPVYDAKDIDDMNVVAMVKGEYQIKTIDLQNELENGNKNNNQMSIPFTFSRQTEVGPIQIGDLFFGCATSDEFPNQNSDCEKKMLKDLDKVSKICARKDNSC